MGRLYECKLEEASHKVSKQTQLIQKLCRDIAKVQDIVHNITKQHNFQELAQNPVQSVQRNSLEDSLLESHMFLKNIGEWLSGVARTHKELQKKADVTESELNVAFTHIE